MHAHKHTYIHTRTQKKTKHTQMYKYASTHKHTHTHTHTHTHAHKHKHTHAHIHMHTYANTHMYIPWSGTKAHAASRTPHAAQHRWSMQKKIKKIKTLLKRDQLDIPLLFLIEKVSNPLYPF